MTRQTRYVDARQRAALLARDRTCVIAGCDVHQRLEIDHVVPFAQGGPTCVTNTKLLCPFHHLLKTKGWLLVGGPGTYRLVPPGTKVDETHDEDMNAVDRSGRAPP